MTRTLRLFFTFSALMCLTLKESAAQITNFETKSVVSSVVVDNSGDRAHLVWVGTYGDGVMQLDLSKRPYGSIYYTAKTGLMSDRIRALFVSQTGTKYIGTDKGFQTFDGRTFKSYTTADGLVNGELNGFCEDTEGNIWIATKAGVSMMSGTVIKKFTEAEGYPAGNVRTISATADGLWMATDKGVAYRNFASGKLRYFTAENGLQSSTVYSVAIAPDGAVWAATPDGVALFEGTTWKAWTRGYRVRCLFIDNQGAVWVGSETEGLFKISADGSQKFTVGNGLFSNAVWALGGDDLGVIWCGTDKGVARVTDINQNERLVGEAYYQRIFMQKSYANLSAALTQYNGYILNTNIRIDEVKRAAFELSELIAMSGDYSRAAAIAKANADNTRSTALYGSSLINAGNWFSKIGQTAEAIAAYRQAADGSTDAESEAVGALRAAQLLEQTADYAQAQRYYQRVAERYATSAVYDEAMVGLGNISKKIGDQQRGDEQHRAVMLSGANFEALYSLGTLQERYRSEQYFRGIKREPTAIRTVSTGGVSATAVAIKGNDVYVGTQGYGLYLAKSGAGIASQVTELGTLKINDLFLGFDKRIWVATNDPAELGKQKKKGGVSEIGPGTRFGVFVSDGAAWTVYKENITAAASRVLSISMTLKGNVWAATGDGLLFGNITGGFGNTVWKYYQNIPSRNIKCLAADINEGVWFFTPDRGLYKFDGSAATLIAPDRQMYSDIRQMKIDGTGKKWLCTDRGLIVLDDTSIPVKWQAFTMDDGLPSNDVTSVAFSPKGGKIAVGTRKGASYFNGEYWVNFTSRDGLVSDDVSGVALSDTDEIWVSTPQGAYGVKENPNDYAKIGESLLAQENAYLISRNPEELAKLYRKIATTEQIRTWADYQIMRLRLREGKISEALQAAKALESRKEFFTDYARYALGRELEKKKAYKEALEVYRTLAGLLSANDKIKTAKVVERMAICADELFVKNELEPLLLTAPVLAGEKFRNELCADAVSRALYKTAFLYLSLNRRPNPTQAKELLLFIAQFQNSTRAGSHTLEMDYLAATIGKTVGDYKSAEACYKHASELQALQSVRKLSFQLMKQMPSFTN